MMHAPYKGYCIYLRSEQRRAYRLLALRWSLRRYIAESRFSDKLSSQYPVLRSVPSKLKPAILLLQITFSYCASKEMLWTRCGGTMNKYSPNFHPHKRSVSVERSPNHSTDDMVVL